MHFLRNYLHISFIFSTFGRRKWKMLQQLNIFYFTFEHFYSIWYKGLKLRNLQQGWKSQESSFKWSLVAIEVKSNNARTNAGLHLFSSKYKPLQAFVVGNEGIPLADFLQTDLRLLFR